MEDEFKRILEEKGIREVYAFLLENYPSFREYIEGENIKYDTEYDADFREWRI